MAGSQVAKDAGSTAVEVGRVFSGAGIDGLILYALVLVAFMLFVIVIWLLYLHSKERREAIAERTLATADCAKQAADFAAAAVLQAEANKELATAFVSSNSADMAFKQALGTLVVDLGQRVEEIEIARRERAKRDGP